MNTPENDTEFFEAGLQQLEDYILSRELYWSSRVHTPDFSQMTLGAMLLVRERLRGWRISGFQQHAAKMDEIHLKWRSAWDTKAGREIHARVELWRNYLNEAGHAPAEFLRQYPYQARLRTILALLLDELRESSPDSLNALDISLHRLWQDGAFVWDPAIAWVFPQKSFWYLYGAPNSQEK